MTRFKELRLKNSKTDINCVSIRMLSKVIGIGVSHISELERGVKSASLNELCKYHNYFGVSIEYLLGETTRKNNTFAEHTAKRDLKYIEKDEINNVSSYKRILNELNNINESVEYEDILIKQTVEFLMGTSSGMLVLSEIANVMFGVTKQEYKNGDILKNSKSLELNRIHNEPMEEIGKKLSNMLLLLREPKYRKLDYNELKIMLNNRNMDEYKDDYSSKCSY